MPLYSNRNIVDEQMRLRLDGLRMKPSGAVWKQVEKNLPADGSITSNRDYRKLLGLLFIGTLVGIGSLVQQIHQPAPEASAMAMKSEIAQKAQPAQGKNDLVVADVKKQAATIRYPSVQKKNSAQAPSAIMVTEPGNTQQTSTVNLASESIQVSQSSVGKESATDLAALPNLTATSSDPYLATRNATMNHQLQKFVKTDFTGWYVGFGNAINNTWLLSKSILSDKNLSLVPTFGLAFDVHIGYQFLSKWGWEAGWVLQSQQGQQYSVNSSLSRSYSASSNVNEISLDYMQFPVTIHYRMAAFSGALNQPMKVDVYGGLQVDRIVNVEETFQGIPSGEVPSVKPLNLSGVIGIDYDFMLPKKPIFFSLGAHVAVSGSTFSKQQDQSLFVNPHNILFGLHAALNFTPSKSH